MFEAKLKDASILKKIVEAIKDLVQDVNFDCTSTGISLQAMDSAHVSLVALLLRGDNFEDYRCDKNVSLGVNLTNMAKILKCASNNDSVTLKSEEGGDHLTFVFESKKKIATFELRLMDLEGEHLGIPDTEYKAVVKMPSIDFKKLCSDMSMLSDTIIIGASKDGAKFSVNGEIGDAVTLVKGGSDADDEEADSLSINLEEDVSLTFALNKLLSFTKATSLSSTVTLSMSGDVPLVTEYSIEDLGYLRFYLAPKIDDENE
eukprot:TRINITY_DN14972_c0_g1_i1.p1 TRINITY_DN14972_c0_g1~~TRINITY_DN14972_c0_g1_i1.p1  ORF type:complete len:260 (-),score=46.99 TRINITY_DN14972_c0_g1_i1:73-852(-)